MLSLHQGFPSASLGPEIVLPNNGTYAVWSQVREQGGYPSSVPSMGQGLPDMQGFPAIFGSGGMRLYPMTANGVPLTTAAYPYACYAGDGVLIMASPTTGTAGLRFDGSEWKPITLGSFSKRGFLTNGQGFVMLYNASGTSAHVSYDYGRTWAAMTLPSGGFVYNAGACNPDVMFTLAYGGNNGSITRDGGRTWSAYTVSSTQNWRGIAGLPNGEIWAANASSATGSYSADFGRTWSAYTWPATPASYCYIGTAGDAVYWSTMASSAKYIWRLRGKGTPPERCNFHGGSPWLTTGELLTPQLINGVYYVLDPSPNVLWASTDGLNFAPITDRYPIPLSVFFNCGRGRGYGYYNGIWYWASY